MAKVTSKLQVTLPKRVAEQYGIAPGDEIEFEAAGEVIHVVPARARHRRLSQAERLRLFDESTARTAARAAQLGVGLDGRVASERGWSRAELYQRGSDDSAGTD